MAFTNCNLAIPVVAVIATLYLSCKAVLVYLKNTNYFQLFLRVSEYLTEDGVTSLTLEELHSEYKEYVKDMGVNTYKGTETWTNN